MSDLDIAIVKYFENKGFEATARAFRREANCGKGNIESKYKLNDIYDFYRANTNLFPKPAAADDDISNLNKKRKADEISSSSAPEASERIFLGNLSFQVSEENIKKFFASCGEILEVDWVKDKTTGKFYGTAFVTFDSVDTAQKAMSYNGKNFLQRPIKMNYAPHRIPKKTENLRTMPPAPKYYDKPQGCRTLFLVSPSSHVVISCIYRVFPSVCQELSLTHDCSTVFSSCRVTWPSRSLKRLCASSSVSAARSTRCVSRCARTVSSRAVASWSSSTSPPSRTRSSCTPSPSWADPCASTSLERRLQIRTASLTAIATHCSHSYSNGTLPTSNVGRIVKWRHGHV